MPLLESFRDAESYDSTLAQEMAHWTKRPARLACDFGRKQWGDQGYEIQAFQLTLQGDLDRYFAFAR